MDGKRAYPDNIGSLQPDLEAYVAAYLLRPCGPNSIPTNFPSSGIEELKGGGIEESGFSLFSLHSSLLTALLVQLYLKADKFWVFKKLRNWAHYWLPVRRRVMWVETRKSAFCADQSKYEPDPDLWIDFRVRR